MEEPDKPKRKIPCENCRTQRRKCISTQASRCERCEEANVECLFVVIEKPTRAKLVVPAAERKRLRNTIWTLEQQAEQIQMELSQIRATSNCIICKDINCIHNRQSEWNLVILNSKKGIQLHTSIKTVSDLEKFLKEGFAFFSSQETIARLSDTGGARMINVTYPITNVESLFKKGLIQAVNKKRGEAGSLLARPNNTLLDQQYQSFKRVMLQNYFTCIGVLVPMLPIPIYYPKLCCNLDSLLTNAIVSIVAYSSCEHVDLTGFSYTRMQLADCYRSIAIKEIREILFEQEPTPEICCALLLISVGCILNPNNEGARTYSNLCWRMISQMKPIYQDVVQEQIRIRVFYLSRYLEFNFLKTSESTHGFTSASFHISNFPTHLECELTDRTIYNSVCCFQFFIRLMSCSAFNPGQNEEKFFGYFSGRVNRIASTTIRDHEIILLQLRKTLPVELQIGSGPFEYTKEVTCTISFVLRANAVYYIYWLIIHCKIMQAPSEFKLPAAHTFRIDGGRALLITSICIDVLSKIYMALITVAPCSVDMYWLATCLDISHLLSTSSDRGIQSRAKTNRTTFSNLLKKKLRTNADWQEDSKDTKPDCSLYSGSCSMASDSSSSSGYGSLCTEDTLHEIHSMPTTPLDDLKESLIQYMIDNKIF